MRRIVGVTVALATWVGAALVGCIAETGSNSEDFTEDGNLYTKATYDAPSQSIVVSFAEELEPGQELYVAVRRGDRRDASLAERDCSLVSARPIAAYAEPPVDTSALAREAHGGRTMYALPLADPSLLVPAYSDAHLPPGESWGHGAVTPAKQAMLDRGVDTLIDICVTDHGRVLRREQVDLFLAMDLNNPHLVRDAMAADAAGVQPRELDHAEERVSSAQKYGELCVAALGEIPFFKNKRQVGADPVTGRPQYAYDTWSCLDSVHIPATVTEADGNGAETVSGPDWDEQSGDESAGAKCDKRQYIYDLCEQGPRVISAENEQGTHWVLLCRKGRGQTPRLEPQGVDDEGNPILVDVVPEEELSTHYNDIAMIGYHPRTGRTCFFQNALYARHDGARVPHPADVQKSQELWSGVHGAQGGINCNNCHDSDPFILSPWIAGATRNAQFDEAQAIMAAEGRNGWATPAELAGKPVVPMYGVHPDLPLKDTSLPYTLVNYIGQHWTHQKQLVGSALEGCNQCHRIGAGNTLDSWALRTVGLDTGYNAMITDAYLHDWKRSHYMPFDPREGQPDPLPSESAWDASIYATAVDTIVQCSSAPQDEDAGPCQFREIPREAADVDPGGGDCWSDIADDCDY